MDLLVLILERLDQQRFVIATDSKPPLKLKRLSLLWACKKHPSNQIFRLGVLA